MKSAKFYEHQLDLFLERGNGASQHSQGGGNANEILRTDG
jgi:hypothetical protein